MKLVIPGNPVSKARSRSFNRNGKIMHYDPQNEEKNNVKNIMKSIIKDYPKDDQIDSYDVHIYFYLPYPKLNKNRIFWNFENANKKPDIDNLAKFYLDCANEIVFSDDQKIVSLYSTKIYSENPRTEIYVKEHAKQIINVTNKALDILELFSFKEFEIFSQEINEFNELSNYISNRESYFLDSFGIQEYEKKLEKAAKFISRFAEKYASILSKVKKKCPNYYKEGSNE